MTWTASVVPLGRAAFMCSTCAAPQHPPCLVVIRLTVVYFRAQLVTVGVEPIPPRPLVRPGVRPSKIQQWSVRLCRRQRLHTVPRARRRRGNTVVAYVALRPCGICGQIESPSCNSSIRTATSYQSTTGGAAEECPMCAVPRPSSSSCGWHLKLLNADILPGFIPKIFFLGSAQLLKLSRITVMLLIA
jgi:hypothetical protein